MTTFAISGVIKITFNGMNGAGNINVPGLKAGDVILRILDSSGGGDDGSLFSSAILKADNTIIQISALDLSAVSFTGVLARF